MAEEKKEKEKEKKKPGKGIPSHGDAIGEIIEMVVILLVISAIATKLLSFFDTMMQSVSAASPYGSSPVGMSISVSKDTPVLDAPAGDVVGKQLAGAKGKVVKGPVFKNGFLYWYIDFETGVDGWVPETVLKKANGGAFSKGDTPIGDRVLSSNPVSVLDTPGGKTIGSQPANAKGTIAEGPIVKDGKRYWFVDFDSGIDGWVAESALKNEDGSAFDAGDTPVGKRFSLTDGSSVFDAAGGKKIGSQDAGAEGTILQGPEFKDGKRYWFVDFDSGPDGWVSEDVLEPAKVMDPGSTPVGGRVALAGENPLGSKVATKEAVALLDTPGGKAIGTQPANAKGTVTQGPIEKDGQRYWFVDFDSGPDGWVAESALKNEDGSAFAPKDMQVFDAPGGKLIGSQVPGALGTVTKGPEMKDGKRYWFVDFDSGPDGWVAEDQLKNADGSAFSAGNTPIGSRAKTADNTVVYDAPAGEIVGGQPAGAKGVITKGPLFKDGERWWYMDFDSGPDGWVAESDLRTLSGAALKAGDTPIGSKTSLKRATTVVDENGKKVGKQSKGASGVVAGGPIVIDGQRYWFVDFDSGPDGWVAESDLAPFEERSLLARVVSVLWRVLKIMLWSVTALLLLWIVITIVRTQQVVAKMTAAISSGPGEVILPAPRNPAWKRVMDLTESDNPSDWKMAIIEADTMLDMMLRGLGYQGETIGDRLKAIEQSDFTMLESAWEAHKVRNRIAHEGGDFLITQREARRVVALYKSVFEEFRYI